MIIFRSFNPICLVFPALLFSATIFTSCSKDKDFKDYYDKSGIWEIQSLQVQYADSSGKVDSTVSYSNCGMFIFYNVDIGAERKEYNGQFGITTYTETHKGFAWYPENGNLNLKLEAAALPARVYAISGKGNTQTWTYSGNNNNLLPGNSPKVNETLTVQRIKTK